MRKIGEIHFYIEPYQMDGSVVIAIEGEDVPPPDELARMIGEMFAQTFAEGLEQEERTIN